VVQSLVTFGFAGVCESEDKDGSLSCFGSEKYEI
jgi:hypothetical protein